MVDQQMGPDLLADTVGGLAAELPPSAVHYSNPGLKNRHLHGFAHNQIWLEIV
jgi:hypothetical protein